MDQTNNTDENLDQQEHKEDKKEILFKSFGLKDFVLKGIEEAGFTHASPIQIQSIPIVLQGKDIIAQAQTGTGKTAAFGIPILNNLSKNDNIEALIITPTRELAMQISEEMLKLGKYGRIKTICMYGGQSVRYQCELLSKKPKIMVATPGRLLDHLSNGRIKNFIPTTIVLDESDEMLDMGFLEDIEEIFKYVPTQRQTLLFSATMPEPIKKLALKILKDPELVKITPTNITNQDIEQQYYIINENERDDAILRLLETQTPTKSLIFTRMKKEADALSKRLKAKGFKADALHGDMEQRDRRETMKRFKENNINILVATDVASRGLDISDVSHVFNYHIPLNPESYVHRIGRTGRAGKKGVAITLATPLEYKDLAKIKQITKAKLEFCEIYDSKDLDGDALLKGINSIKVSDESLGVYEQLKEKMDTTQLCLKLLNAYLDKTNHKKIGLSKKEILELESNSESSDKNRSNKNRSRNSKNTKSTQGRYGRSQGKDDKKGFGGKKGGNNGRGGNGRNNKGRGGFERDTGNIDDPIWQ